MLLFCAILTCIYLIGFSITMKLTNRDFDLALAWPLLAPILILRAIFVGISYLIKEW